MKKVVGIVIIIIYSTSLDNLILVYCQHSAQSLISNAFSEPTFTCYANSEFHNLQKKKLIFLYILDFVILRIGRNKNV